MKIELNGIGSNVSKGDFGEMGISLNPLDWFSSPKTFTKAQNISAANAWLVGIFNALKPNATYSTFIEALKLDNYGSKISDEDYQDFLDTLGFNVNTSPAIAEKVKASLLKSFTSKNMLPNRRNIISAYLNPDIVKWTYWDAVKVTTSQGAQAAVNVAETAAAVVSTGFNILAHWKLLALGAVAVGGFIVYRNRKIVLDRLNEKALKTIGLGQ